MATLEERWAERLIGIVRLRVQGGQSLEQAVEVAKAQVARYLLADVHLNDGVRRRLAEHLVRVAEGVLESGLPTPSPATISISVVDTACFDGGSDRLQQRRLKRQAARAFNPRKNKRKGKPSHDIE